MHSLGLTICLGVVAGAEDGAGTQQTPKLLPERRSEPQVVDDVIRYPKQGDHVCKEQLGHLLARKLPIAQPARYQARILCEMLHDSQNCIVPIAKWQMCNKIDTVGAETTVYLQMNQDKWRKILSKSLHPL